MVKTTWNILKQSLPTTSTALPLAVLVALTAGGTSAGRAADAPFKVLYNFGYNQTDGGYPTDGLLKDKAGNLYGTTIYGGPNNTGTVFKLTPDGKETVLYFFTGGSDGGQPYDGVIEDKAGNLYGTTYGGGAGNRGVVFKVAPDGTETVLHAFTGQDGEYLYGGLIMDKKGNLYGTTYAGGTSGGGVVFKLASDGTFTVLHNFSGTDGSGPKAGLISDEAGNFYGTTEQGGTSGAGTLFKLARDGTLTVLHSFTQYSDGGYPVAAPILDGAGNLYGTTLAGGANSNDGVLYKVAPDGTLTALVTFTGSNGAVPYAGLIEDKAGNLYGTTSQGGPHGYGAVFKLAANGTETILYSFNGSIGDSPQGGLVRDTAAANSHYLFSTTWAAGTLNGGTVFEIRK